MTVLPTIRRQLLQAAERNAAAGAPGLTWPRSNWRVPWRLALATSHLVTATLIAVTVVVAVGAILLLGHGRHAQPVAASSSANSRPQLLQTLGVIGASPTATDRAATACIERTFNKYGEFKCYRDLPDYSGTVVWVTEHPAPVALQAIASLGHPKWALTLIRIIPVGSPGESVTFYPGNWRGIIGAGDVSSAPRGKRNWGVVAVFAVRRAEIATSLPTTVGTVRAQGLVLAVPSASMTVAIIVPDGVAKVTVGMVRLGRQHWLENVTAAVRDNIATLQLKAAGLRLQLPTQYVTAQVTWLNAGGEAIRHTTNVMEWGG